MTLDNRQRLGWAFVYHNWEGLCNHLKEERMFVLYLSFGKVTMHQIILYHEKYIHKGCVCVCVSMYIYSHVKSDPPMISSSMNSNAPPFSQKRQLQCCHRRELWCFFIFMWV